MLNKSLSERRSLLRDLVLCKSLSVTGVQNMAEGQQVMKTYLREDLRVT